MGENEIEVNENETQEMLESVQLENIEEAVNEIEIKKEAKPIKEDRKKTKELYAEFSSFLETKAEITEDKGIKETISTGIDLIDAILGGGFGIGALSIIVGQPGSGKSMLAIQTLGQGERQFGETKTDPGLMGFFLDSEEATTKIRLRNLGVKRPKIYTDVTVEKVFKLVEGLSVFTKEKNLTNPSIVVWDSIANTLSQKERETDDPNSVIGYKARLLSILVPKYVAKCAQNRICLLAVNQLRDVISIGQFAPPKDLKLMSHTKDMPGGNVLKFNAFQLLEMKVKSVIAPGKTYDSVKYGFEGVIVKMKCVKNKLFQPNVEIDVVGSFVNGFSNFWTNFNFLKDNKRLHTGSWNYLISLPDKKFRMKDAPSLYAVDAEFKEAYDKASKEVIETEIINKYNIEIDEDDD
jgi:RecA/RadA recombinase